MSTVPAVYAAINKVMATLAKDGIQKERNNAQQGYKFRGIDDVYNALAPALVNAGLIVIPAMLSRTCEERTTAKGSVLFYVNVAAEFRLIAVSDGSDVKAGPFFGEAMDSGDKATNKAMSAAYKYWAMQTFAIPTDADNDADSTTHSDIQAKRPRNPAFENGEAHTARGVAVDALAKMDPEQQQWLRDQAVEIMGVFKDKGDLHEFIERQKYDMEEKLALWSLLPSDCRSAIKRAQKAANAPTAAMSPDGKVTEATV